MSFVEKRRFLRFVDESEVKIKFKDTINTYQMKNFSAGGFMIVYAEGFEIGDIVDVMIDFGYGEFATKAKVKWQKKDVGIGFEFLDTQLFS
ncbi:PilZ domain-containing protein [Defluviitalea phaphyphila]|uniref:PilZ domain-containing protein n=1 Tax=Defluviitalea phaphyphila TaxID=1473580 RepID=UPI0007312B06|nr:PilZ domain-containing protein [Defluviitalea phaphyphila]